MIFLARSSAACKDRSLRRTHKWLRVICAQIRARWVEEFGPLKSRSLRMPVVQIATRKLSAKYSRQLRLFTTRNNQGCDIVISGFDGLLANAPGLKAIFQVDGEQLDLGLIVYLNMDNTFTRVDIQKMIQVWDGSVDESTLDDFSRQFFTKTQEGNQIREDLSIIHTRRARGFPDRNYVQTDRSHTLRQSLTQHWGCPLCPSRFRSHIAADRHTDIYHRGSTTQLIDLRSTVSQHQPLKRWVCPVCDKQFEAWSRCNDHIKSHSPTAQKQKEHPPRIISYVQVALE